MTSYTANMLPVGDKRGYFPPYMDGRRDAELEALRYGFLQLTTCLHESGMLDMQKVSAQMRDAEWCFPETSPTRESIDNLVDLLEYVRAKLGAPKRSVA